LKIAGTYQSTEVAYFTYAYAKVDKEHYQKVTSYSRSALLTGHFIASLTGQFLVKADLMDYKQLNYLTLAGESLKSKGSNHP
jgi:thiamine transporter 2/3